MVVIRYEGPRGAPGMPEMPEMLDPTSRITALCRRRGITIALMTDARFSGGSVGLVIGHVSPEAALGGPIALVEDGDAIVVDVNRTPLTAPSSRTRRQRPRATRGGMPRRSAMAGPTRWSGRPTLDCSGGCAPGLCPAPGRRAVGRCAFRIPGPAGRHALHQLIRGRGCGKRRGSGVPIGRCPRWPLDPLSSFNPAGKDLLTVRAGHGGHITAAGSQTGTEHAPIHPAEQSRLSRSETTGQGQGTSDPGLR